ncbi:tubulin-like doman-containing protein [Ammoniphilus sp. YIM 78166]|uniref:tubulin-like doman-containing protein n=1 Tax=Ammoniphilus sp. YIM 78166 TaxID=1644106 RepID=UPI00106F61B4|nr:tubulin-like doman-containing protein [Ammoniphilus sp. YIM 78166]
MSKITIDNVWELESFVKQRGASLGTQFGFIGLGQGGGKIVDAFAGIRNPVNQEPCYPVLCINTNQGDIDSLKNVDKNNRLALKGKEFEKGAGMDPEKGRAAIETNGESVFGAVQRVMKDAEVIVIVASLGGGTGTGSINMLIDVCADYIGKPVMAIVSLPNPHIDENINAFNALKELTAKLEEIREDGQGSQYRVLENLIILDNKKIIEDHLEAKDQGEEEATHLAWDRYSNYKVASILHEWNVVTTLESDKTLDAEDFKNKLLLTGGLLTFAKKKINLQETNLKSEADLIHEIVSTYRGKNVLANGFNYEQDAIAFGLHVVMPKNKEDILNANTLEKINRRLQEELEVPIYYGRSTWDSKHALVYTIVSLRGLPERAKYLREESEELIRKQREREEKSSGFNIDGDLNVNPFKKTGARSRMVTNSDAPVNPFAVKKEIAAASSNEVKNPFKMKRN